MSRKALLVVFLFFPMTGFVHAQSLDDFLACEEFTDRVERVICLEEALEEATVSSEPEDVVENVTAVEEFGQEQEAGPVNDEANEDNSSRGFLPRIRMPSIGGIFSRDQNNNEEAEEAQEESQVESTEETSSASSVESFGREQARVVENEDGREELVDVVSEIDTYRNMLTITLASGQVWRQTHTKRFNLRKGDEVRIYPSRWGESFRLETDRLNGFIQVGRVQ